MPPAVDYTGIFLCVFPQPPRIIPFGKHLFTISRHNPLYKHCPPQEHPLPLQHTTFAPEAAVAGASPVTHIITLQTSPLPPLACSRHTILAPMSRLPHTCPCARRTFQPHAQNESRPHFSPKCQAGSTPPLAAAPTAAALFFYSPVRKTTILACKTKAGRISLPNAKPAPHLHKPQPQQPQLSFFIRPSARQQYLPVKRRHLSASYDTSPVTGSTFSSAASSSPISSNVRCPASALILRSISSANAWLSRNTCLAFSRPCPSFSPL